jgi:hypothetical protein
VPSKKNIGKKTLGKENSALCRVFSSGRSTKKLFVECQAKKNLGKKHSAKKLFAEYFIFDTRQRVCLQSVF